MSTTDNYTHTFSFPMIHSMIGGLLYQLSEEPPAYLLVTNIQPFSEEKSWGEVCTEALKTLINQAKAVLPQSNIYAIHFAGKNAGSPMLLFSPKGTTTVIQAMIEIAGRSCK